MLMGEKGNAAQRGRTGEGEMGRAVKTQIPERKKTRAKCWCDN